MWSSVSISIVTTSVRPGVSVNRVGDSFITSCISFISSSDKIYPSLTHFIPGFNKLVCNTEHMSKESTFHNLVRTFQLGP